MAGTPETHSPFMTTVAVTTGAGQKLSTLLNAIYSNITDSTMRRRM
jgi:hypothetical protein